MANLLKRLMETKSHLGKAQLKSQNPKITPNLGKVPRSPSLSLEKATLLVKNSNSTAF